MIQPPTTSVQLIYSMHFISKTDLGASCPPGRRGMCGGEPSRRIVPHLRRSSAQRTTWTVNSTRPAEFADLAGTPGLTPAVGRCSCAIPRSRT